MSPEEIEKAINKIAWGGRFIEARDCSGNRRPLIIKSLSIRERNFVEFIYESALQEALEAGALSKFDLYVIYKRRGVWTAQDDVQVEESRDKIEALKDTQEKARGKEKRVLAVKLDRLIASFGHLLEKRRNLFHVAAETHAAEQRSLALIFCATYDDQERKLWDDWQEFLNEADDLFIASILVGINKMQQYTVREMRQIARSNMWRFRWNGVKHTGDLFGKPVVEFDSEQQNLLYWSQVYDSVYDAYERPSDAIINDDEALDKWFENQNKKEKQKRVTEKGDIGKMKMSGKMRGHGEVFVVVNPEVNPNAPSMEEVSELNTELVRTFKRAEEAKIKKSGSIKETELRERGNRISRKMIGSKDAILGKGSFGQAKGGKSAGKILPGGSIS